MLQMKWPEPKLVAGAVGTSVVALCYGQLALGIFGLDVESSVRVAGLMPMRAQLGYALGTFLVAALGDTFNHFRIILVIARPNYSP